MRTRIDSMGDMKDVVSTTKALFEVSKETARLEHESFALRQRVQLASEIKSTLDSWVRFEAQQREDEQRQLVAGVIDKVQKGLSDPQLQKDILASAISDVRRQIILTVLTGAGRRPREIAEDLSASTPALRLRDVAAAARRPLYISVQPLTRPWTADRTSCTDRLPNRRNCDARPARPCSHEWPEARSLRRLDGRRTAQRRR